jgi:hypothetical protein
MTNEEQKDRKMHLSLDLPRRPVNGGEVF